MEVLSFTPFCREQAKRLHLSVFLPVAHVHVLQPFTFSRSAVHVHVLQSEGSAPGGVSGQSPLRGPGAAPLEAIRFSQSDKVKSTQPVMHK